MVLPHRDPSLGPALDIILGRSHIFSQESPSQSYRRGPKPVFLKGLWGSGPKCGKARTSMNLSPRLFWARQTPAGVLRWTHSDRLPGL